MVNWFLKLEKGCHRAIYVLHYTSSWYILRWKLPEYLHMVALCSKHTEKKELAGYPQGGDFDSITPYTTVQRRRGGGSCGGWDGSSLGHAQQRRERRRRQRQNSPPGALGGGFGGSDDSGAGSDFCSISHITSTSSYPHDWTSSRSFVRPVSLVRPSEEESTAKYQCQSFIISIDHQEVNLVGKYWVSSSVRYIRMCRS